MRLLALLAALVLPAVIVAAPVPKEKGKATAIDGTWEMVERHLSGTRDDSASTTRWVVDGKSLAIEMRDKGGQFRKLAGATYRLQRPEGDPANAIDYTHVPADNGTPASTFGGIFESDDDTLKVCLPSSPGRDRPTEFKALAGTNLYVFKRVKDEKKDEPKKDK